MPARTAQPYARKYPPSITPKSGRPARVGDDDSRIPLADPDEDPAPDRPRWRLDADAADLGRLPADDATGEAPGCEPPSDYKLVLGVLVYTPRMPRLDDGPELRAMHLELVDLLQRRRLSPRVIIDLSNVTSISTTFLAVLVVHSDWLAKAGGAVRLAHVVPAILAILEKYRRPFRPYPRIDDAVLERW